MSLDVTQVAALAGGHGCVVLVAAAVVAPIFNLMSPQFLSFLLALVSRPFQGARVQRPRGWPQLRDACG